MMIKIIDWISRITAIALAIGGAYFQILFAAMAEPDEFGWWIVIFSILLWSVPHLGLFLAPVARQKGIICRVMVAVLMLPSFVLFFLLSIGIVIKESYDSLSVISTARGVIQGFIVCILGFIVYLTQYNLLFKDRPFKFLFKPIYLRHYLKMQIFKKEKCV